LAPRKTETVKKTKPAAAKSKKVASPAPKAKTKASAKPAKAAKAKSVKPAKAAAKKVAPAKTAKPVKKAAPKKAPVKKAKPAAKKEPATSGRSVLYNALQIQKESGSKLYVEPAPGPKVSTKAELANRNKTLRATPGARDPAAKSLGTVKAPKKGGMVAAKGGRAIAAPKGKGIDAKELSLKAKTLKKTAPAKDPAKKKVSTTKAPAKGGMVKGAARKKAA